MTPLIRLRRRVAPAGHQAGNSIVEGALATPMVLLLTLAIFDFTAAVVSSPRSGDLVQHNLGTIPETSESMLMRVLEDKALPHDNSAQTAARDYFEATGPRVGPAFEALQSEILRSSR